MHRLALVALLTVLVGAGCQEGPVEPVQEPGPTTPALNFAEGPNQPGPQIFRFEDVFIPSWVDAKRGLRAWAGIDIVEYCSGTFDPDLADYQEILSPAEADRILRLTQGEGLAGSVWTFTEFDCGRYLTEEPLVEGPVDLTNTDNDVEAFSRENRNWNTFGFSVHGAFSGHERCRWDGDDAASLTCDRSIVVP